MITNKMIKAAAAATEPILYVMKLETVPVKPQNILQV